MRGSSLRGGTRASAPTLPVAAVLACFACGVTGDRAALADGSLARHARKRDVLFVQAGESRDERERAERERYCACYERRAGRRVRSRPDSGWPRPVRDPDQHWAIVRACLEELRPPDAPPGPYVPDWWGGDASAMPI